MLACRAAPEPPDRDRALLLAEAELARGRPDEAGRRFQAVLDGAPDETRALDGLARSELAAGRPEAAYAALERLDGLGEPAGGPPAPVDATHCAVWAAVLDARAAVDRLEEALALADRRDAGRCDADATRMGRGLAHRVRADAARSQGRDVEALEQYRRAAEWLGPATPVEVYRSGGELLIADGRYDQAVEWLDRGLDLHPRDRRLLTLMVNALSGGLGPHP
jgi:tetratricopeptide (TPR) repeat protein